jgi:hypothetical protein
MSDIAINNPTRWFYALDQEAEWWSNGGKTREECIATAAQGDQPVWIVEAKRMAPNFGIFDAEELLERLTEDECWGEDGAEGVPCFSRSAPEHLELESELTDVLRRWYIKHGGTLDGAQLDFVQGPERVDPVRPA